MHRVSVRSDALPFVSGVHNALGSSSPRRSRSTSSAGSSSPSTGTNEKARIGRAVPRGRSVRNASRMARSSNVRRTAISISRGWSHSEAANATSSSAALVAASRSGRRTARRAFCEHRHGCGAIRFARVDDLHQGGPAKRCDAEKTAAEGGARLALEACGLRIRKHERAGHGPFPGSAARPNTNVSDGSRRMVRRSLGIAALFSRCGVRWLRGRATTAP